IFELYGIKMAVASRLVEGALSVDTVDLVPNGKAEWVLGRYLSPQGHTALVDTAQFLLPDRFDPDSAKYKDLIVLKGRHWALACDDLLSCCRMAHDDVVWSTESSDRAWLAGTSMVHKCGILDVEQIIKMLDNEVSSD
ncbi:MAG: hypothetical protein ACPGPF_04425, partial [Pontibacterium sp.]